MSNQINVSITFKSIILVLLTLLAVYFIGDVLGLVFLFFLAYILASALRPLINWLNKIGIPFIVSSVLVIFSLIFFFIVAIGSLVPLLAEQARSLYEKRTEIISSIESLADSLPPAFSEGISAYIHTLPAVFTNYLVSPGILQNILGILTGIGGILLFLIVTIYILIDRSTPLNLIKKYWPKDTKGVALEAFRAFELKISHWVRGQVILSLLVGILSYIGLKILGVQYAELLAVFTAIMGLVPYIGPWISGALAVIIALITSPLLAVYVIILYVVVQQLESAVLVPRIMKRAVDLSPVSILFIITAGMTTFGIMGAIIMIPLAAGIKAATEIYIKRADV